MFCKHCGSQIADDAIFCSKCGTRLVDDVPPAPQVQQPEVDVPQVQAQISEEPQAVAQEQTAAAPVSDGQEVPAKPFLEGMEWNVSEYPDSNTTTKTEDIDFDWGMDSVEVPELRARTEQPVEPVQVSVPKTPEAETVSRVFDRVVPEEEAKASIPVKEALEAANKVEEVGQFNTFNRKNAEFQQLLDREHDKLRGAGTIGDEQIRADEVAAQRFEARKEEVNMDDFLQQEGVVKLYEPQALETDVLERIEALEREKARKEAEEAARIKALEEARAEALAKKKAEEERINAEIEARAAAEAEMRQAEEAEALRLKEEEARRKAAEDAARLEAIAQRQAEEEARRQEELRLRAAEEARLKAEAEAKAKAEEEARREAEAKAKAAAEEEARLKAEAELKAAQEAARIRAQREAALAAKEEAEFKAAQARKQREEEIARLKREADEKQRARSEESAVVEDEVRKALEQTAKMRQEEEDKIKAALAGIRGGRFSDTISSTEKALPEEKPPISDTIQGKREPKAPAPPQELDLEPVETEIKPEPTKEFATPEGTVFAGRDEIEEAHRHTRYNIEGMAKAREDFFADLPGGDPEAERKAEGQTKDSTDSIVSPLTRTVDKEAIASGLTSTKKLTRESFDGLITEAPAEAPVETPAPETEDILQAQGTADTDDLLSQFVSVMDTERIEQEAAPVAEEMPSVQPVAEEMPSVQPVTEDVVRAPEETPIEEIALVTPVEETVPAEQPVPEIQPVAEQIPETQPVAAEPTIPTEPVAEPVYDPALEALKAEKPGLEDTMVMPGIEHIDEFSKSDIDNYGTADADELMRLKEAAIRQEAESQERTAAAAAEIATTGVSTGEAYDILEQIEQDAQKIQQETEQVERPEEEAPLTAKELKKQERAKAKEAKKQAREKKKEEKRRKKEDAIGDDETREIVEATENADGVVETEEDTGKGGKGRLVLMIILILLCVIFALELVGIGIKMFASTSAAADFIDNILNKIIQMITGSSGGGTWIG